MFLDFAFWIFKKMKISKSMKNRNFMTFFKNELDFLFLLILVMKFNNEVQKSFRFRIYELKKHQNAK
ncbi:hypothetical protein B0A63_24415 [Flavobacterium johnsoniae UW101]|nr:hypothetical protein B0A63_24415 [Flavobacterium johnsoniae UW101]